MRRARMRERVKERNKIKWKVSSQHPIQPIRLLFNREYFPCIFFHTPPSFPESSCLLHEWQSRGIINTWFCTDHFAGSYASRRRVGIVKLRVRVIGRSHLAKQDFDSFQLLSVSGGYGNFDLNLGNPTVSARTL